MRRGIKNLIVFCVLFFSTSIYYSCLGNTDDDYSRLVREAEEHYLKAKEYNSQGEYLKAEEEFKKAEELLTKAFSLSVIEDNKSSKKEDKVNFKDSHLDTILKDISNALAEDNLHKAIEAYLQLLKLQPHNPHIHYNLAILYLQLGYYWEASQYLLSTLELDPNDSDAYYNLGILYEIFLNDKDKAIACYKKYLNLSPRAWDRKLVESWINSLKKK
ncbi:MAG: tetratricopeptide repeat protein [Candidatus Omnitrophica bacterium]|nr:tetratricopeptide repeat protein [Candidatus Omnitrophota bacterium]MCM8826540.1 tetratricopeptide repeat protein [Candidatus Omnitrophota bacterium]